MPINQPTDQLSFEEPIKQIPINQTNNSNLNTKLETHNTNQLIKQPSPDFVDVGKNLTSSKPSTLEIDNQLLKACEKGKVKEIKVLLSKNNIDVNEKDENTFTPLIYACQYGYLEAVELLLQDPRLDINCEDKCGQTAFYHACSVNQKEIVKSLLRHPNLDVNIADKSIGWSPLICASIRGYSEIVELILTSPKLVDLEATNKLGATALDCARAENKMDIIKLLEAYEKNPTEIRTQLQKKYGKT